jgi:GNAT superfamily N-acetyltransferase
MALTFQEEKLRSVLEEIKPLLKKHWQEIARNKEIIPLEPDYETYAALEREYKLCICTARDAEKLVGYAVYIYDRQLHYPVLWAESDIFWIDQSSRRPRAAHRLLQFAEESLKRRGVRVIHTRTKLAHPAAGRVLESLGHVPIEMVYAKVL